MWTPTNIEALRERLGMNQTEFAKLLGVDARTVRRWEAGTAKPTGAAEAVMNGIEESLNRDPAGAAAIVALIAGAAAVGGLAYVIVKLIDRLRSQDR